MKGTSIPARVRQAIRVRDNCQCQRCGTRVVSGELHHRRRRAVGDDPHALSNLVTLCGGPGHDGCHQWVHAHPEAATRAGFIVSMHHDGDVAGVPVLTFDGLVRFDDDGFVYHHVPDAP